LGVSDLTYRDVATSIAIGLRHFTIPATRPR
jgi:hypothetical protein